MKILGIDPGLKKYGLALIEGNKVFAYKLLKPQTNEGEERLLWIYETLDSLLKEWKPDYAFIEKIVYHRNVGTAIMLGSVRGITLLALNRNGIPVAELSPTRIKRSISLSGRSSKSQVAFMVKKILGLEENLPEDVMDALACALAGKRWLEVNRIYARND